MIAAVAELLLFLSEGGVGKRGKCSVDEEWDDLLLMLVILFVFPNLNRPFNFCPNWEAEVERDRVPVEEKVGLLDLEVEFVIVVCTAWTMVPREREADDKARWLTL